MATKTKTESPARGKTPEDKAIAKAPTAAVPAKTPGKPVGGRGFENLEREDILLPRIKLLQPMSPEVTGELEQEVGTMFMPLSNKNLGKKIRIIPILHFRSRIKWFPKDDGGGIDCSAPDARNPRDSKYSTACATCPHKEWDNEAEKKKDQAPRCTLYENFLVLVGDSLEPVLLPMERTKAKAAKKFWSMASLKGGDMWDNVYELSAVKEKTDDHTYYNYSVADIGQKTSTKQSELCERFWTSLVNKDLTKNMEHPDEGRESAPSATGTTQPGSKY